MFPVWKLREGTETKNPSGAWLRRGSGANLLRIPAFRPVRLLETARTSLHTRTGRHPLARLAKDKSVYGSSCQPRCAGTPRQGGAICSAGGALSTRLWNYFLARRGGRFSPRRRHCLHRPTQDRPCCLTAYRSAACAGRPFRPGWPAGQGRHHRRRAASLAADGAVSGAA